MKKSTKIISKFLQKPKRVETTKSTKYKILYYMSRYNSALPRFSQKRFN